MRRPLSPLRKVGVLVLPWASVALYALVYVTLLVPRLNDGHLAAMCVGGVAGLVLATCILAAIMFSRDVLLDRWPEYARP